MYIYTIFRFKNSIGGGYRAVVVREKARGALRCVAGRWLAEGCAACAGEGGAEDREGGAEDRAGREAGWAEARPGQAGHGSG